MDKYERRRLRLLRIRDEECGRKVANLARRLGKADTYVHRMLYEEGKTGKKRIGEDSVDDVMREFGVDLDAPDISLAPPIQEDRRQLQWVSDDEAMLLSHYRACDHHDRVTALSLLEGLPKKLANDRADQG